MSLDRLAPDCDPSDRSSLSHLSSRLLAHGFISRPLHLSALFPPPASSSSSSSSSHALSKTSLLRAQAATRDQLARCFWNMLAAMERERGAWEEGRGRLNVVEYELEREKNALKTARRDKENANREWEAEKSKAKAATAALAQEQQAHKRTLAELSKAKLAHQLLKSQSLQEQKRRDLSVSQLTTRLSSLPSVTPSSFRLLNPSSNIPSSTASTTNTQRSFLEESLTQSERERGELMGENQELRVVLGEIDEWCEGVMELDRIGQPLAPLLALPDVANPHLSLPPFQFAPRLHSAMHHIRMKVVEAFEKQDEELDEIRRTVGSELEAEREKAEEERKERERLGEELDAAAQLLEENDKLVRDFTEGAFLRQATGSDGGVATVTAADDSIEDVDPFPSADELAQKAQQDRLARLAKEEARRAQMVKDMLGELGDSPAPPSRENSTLEGAGVSQKEVSKKEHNEKPSEDGSNTVTSTAGTTSKPKSSTSTSKSSKSRESTSSTSSKHSSKHPSSLTSRPQLSPLAEASESPSPSIDTLPSPFLRPSTVATTSTKPPSTDTIPKTRATLSDLLAFAQSPPPAVQGMMTTAKGERKVSAAGGGREKERAREGRKENSAPAASAGGSLRARSSMAGRSPLGASRTTRS